MNRYTPIGIALLSLISYSAEGQTQCGPLEMAEASLRDSFGEKPLIEWDVQMAEGSPSRTIRAYANTQTGSLTLILIFEHEGKSVACLAGSGQNMRIAPQFKPAEHPL